MTSNPVLHDRLDEIGKVVVYHAKTGKRLYMWAVDASRLLRQGTVVLDEPQATAASAVPESKPAAKSSMASQTPKPKAAAKASDD